MASRPRLAGAAFGVLFAGIVGHSSGALASCTVSGLAGGGATNSVSCDTTVTSASTNFDGTLTTSSDYKQQFTGGGAVTAGINAGQTVSGSGLWINTAEPGAPIIFTNNGAMTGDSLHLTATGGNITYSGNGSVSASSGLPGLFLETGGGSITVGASGAPVTANFSGPAALNASSGTGAVSVFLNGGSLTLTNGSGQGLAVSAGGNASVTLTGNTTIANTSGVAGTSIGVFAVGGGTVNVTSDANIGSAGAMIGNGIGAIGTGTGSVSVFQTGGTILAGTAGISAFIINGANTNDITVVANGNVNAATKAGIAAETTGTGNLHVSVGAGATVQSPSDDGIFLFGGAANTVTNNGAISGATGLVTKTGSTTVTNAGSITGTGGTAVTFAGANNLFIMSGPAAALTGQAVGSGTDTFRFAGTGSNSFDASQIGAGWTLLDKTGSSVWSLTGTSTYAGPVTVNGGTLAVNGDLSSASSFTVNAGGTLGGNGIAGAVAINGGTLAPGNSIGTLTTASLTMTAASTYLLQVSGAASDKTVVTGIASIGGKVVVDPLTRLSATTTYTIMTAGTLSGTFSGAEFLTATSFARNARLAYVGNDVLLTLDPGLLSPSLPGNANINQRNVAAGIDNGLVGGGALPAGLNALFALSGTPLLNALTQASGETATGAQQTTFNAMNLFMGVLTDPFVAGRGDPRSSGGATGYAADDSDALAYGGGRKRTGAERDAYAAIYRKAPQPFEARWSVWAAGFGGSQTTDGNGALGSNAATSRIAGGVAGADYWFSPNTVAGFALAGGGTNFSVANGGTGRSDLFQAGAFVRHDAGPAYVTGALAYGWQDVTTDRTVTIAGADHLQARFNANAYSGRLEGGYRLVVPVIGGVGLTPYAAAQFTTLDLPAYTESTVTGVGTFALAYSAKTVTDTRSELGLRTDKSFAMADGVTTLRGRLAWAHDFNPDRAVGATFQALPGASFVVNGAAQAADSALVTASAEKAWLNGWSAAATFEGEFSNVTRSYAGKGVARYQW
ncbi:autotransporter outer membrane beta-barrel domain-containing protein [Bradyrhizobium ganzhouense]|uniref:autotransporter outer membrane beta-barrel domain-containing protein n=1 Tax=Bradyrhizobium ganzhouense TaxID=1179767 RepID=UPI003CE83337